MQNTYISHNRHHERRRQGDQFPHLCRKATLESQEEVPHLALYQPGNAPQAAERAEVSSGFR